MTENLPPDLAQFVNEEIARGRYPSADELVLSAIRLLRERELRREQFRAELQQRIERLDRGEGIPVELADLRGFFDELIGEVDTELAAEKNLGS